MAFSLTRGSYNKLRQLLWLLPDVILIDMQVDEMIMFCNRVIGNWQEPYGCRFIVCNAIALMLYFITKR